MKFSELDPVLTQTELTLTCPFCKGRFPIKIKYQRPPEDSSEGRFWGLTHPENNFSWDTVTITPSIANHPQARNKPKCNAHFSIINGDIL